MVSLAIQFTQADNRYRFSALSTICVPLLSGVLFG